MFTCEVCGKEFEGRHGNPNRFCSIKCKGAWQSEHLRGENNPNWFPIKKIKSSNKHSLRKKIKARDKICQECGITTYLQVHHIDSDPLNNSSNNLILLCKFCHAKYHPENTNLILSNRAYSKKTLPPRKCIQCSKEFQPRFEKTQHCSRKCGAKTTAQKNMGRRPWNFGMGRVELMCHNCNKRFETRMYRIRNKSKSGFHFCSKACQVDYFFVKHRAPKFS